MPGPARSSREGGCPQNRVIASDGEVSSVEFVPYLARFGACMGWGLGSARISLSR